MDDLEVANNIMGSIVGHSRQVESATFGSLSAHSANREK